MTKIQKTNKHNKKRNTAFLYEALIAELAKTSMNKEKEKSEKILSIIKEFFSKGKLLSKELKLYKTLVETKCRNYNVASRLLNEVRREWTVLVSNEDIYGEQSKLIKKINTEAPSVYKNFIPNYKNLASVYQIFSDKTPAKSKVIMEEKYIDELCLLEEKEEIQPIDNLAYRIFLKKFNEQYGESLCENQKKTLTYYIMSFADDGLTLKSYLNEEIENLKKIILGSKEINENKEMKNKAEKVLEFLNSFKEKKIDDNMVQKILEVESLAKEIQTGEKDSEN
jgi:hypothetical protein